MSNSSKDISENRLPKKVQDIIDLIPDDKKDSAQNILTSFISVEISRIQESHSGPIPSPRALDKYNQIIPNGADRIMQMAEKQSLHRMEIEKTALKKQFSQSNLGQIFAFIIALVCVAAAVYLAISGYPVVAGVIGGTTIVGLVSAFIYGRKEVKKSLEEKD